MKLKRGDALGGSVPGPTGSDGHLDAERLAALLEPLSSPVRLRLLRLLTAPHYLEEIASHVGLTRQATRKHLDKLVAIGVLAKRSGTRDSGAVTEYVIDQQALFLIYDEFEKLASLRGEEQRDVLYRTRAEGASMRATPPAVGPSFQVVHGLNTGHRIPLGRAISGEFVLGRDAQCDLALTYDPYVSNRHAEITWDAGRFVLTDLRSTNGTRHNWKLMPAGGEVVLRHGDLVSVGRTLLLFWDGERA